jgi:hypothetical protein
MFFHQVVVVFLLVSLTLWLQSAGIVRLVAWVPGRLRGDQVTGGAAQSSEEVRGTK